MTHSNLNTADPTPALPERDVPNWSQRQHQYLLGERDIALQFGDASLALQHTRDLHKLHEIQLRDALKTSRTLTSRVAIAGPSSPDAADVLRPMEEDLRFVEQLNRTILHYGDLELVRACAAETAMLERHVAALRPDPGDQRPKGILALMGLT